MITQILVIMMKINQMGSYINLKVNSQQGFLPLLTLTVELFQLFSIYLPTFFLIDILYLTRLRLIITLKDLVLIPFLGTRVV